LFEYFVFFELVNLVPKGTEDLFVDVCSMREVLEYGVDD
jgi:hypothetical protein